MRTHRTFCYVKNLHIFHVSFYILHREQPHSRTVRFLVILYIKPKRSSLLFRHFGLTKESYVYW